MALHPDLQYLAHVLQVNSCLLVFFKDSTNDLPLDWPHLVGLWHQKCHSGCILVRAKDLGCSSLSRSLIYFLLFFHMPTLCIIVREPLLGNRRCGEGSLRVDRGHSWASADSGH